MKHVAKLLKAIRLLAFTLNPAGKLTCYLKNHQDKIPDGVGNFLASGFIGDVYSFDNDTKIIKFFNVTEDLWQQHVQPVLQRLKRNPDPEVSRVFDFGVVTTVSGYDRFHEKDITRIIGYYISEKLLPVPNKRTVEFEQFRQKHIKQHSDLKLPTSNIMQNERGDLKLIDLESMRSLDKLVFAAVESPNVDYPPAGINIRALPIWKATLNTYNEIIFTSAGNNMWDTAIRLFEKACKQRNIKPWRS